MNWELKKHALTLVLFSSLSALQAQTVDLANQNSGFVDGVLYEWTDFTPTGTGNIQSFVRIQRKGVEQGYNTSGRPVPFDEKEPQNFTHDIQVKDLGAGTNVNGVLCYQFLLDINEPSGDKAYISLDEIRIYTGPEGGLRGADLNALGTLRYNLKAGANNWILLDASRNSGSGSGDLFMYIPTSFFAGASPEDYVYLYSKFGSFFPTRSDDSEAGFEEWAIVVHEPTGCHAITATGGSITCEKTSIQLSASSDMPNSTFRWTGPNGFESVQQNPTVTVPGTYSVTVTAGNCQRTAIAQVNDSTIQFNVTATGGQLTCNQLTVQLSAVSSREGVNFSWTGPGIVSGANTANPVVNLPGTYIVTARDGATGCNATASATVTQSTTEFTVTATGGTLDCTNLTVQLSASSSAPGATFSWSGPGIVSGANTATPTVNQPGVYTVIATITNCTSAATASVGSEVTEETFTPNLPTQQVHFKAYDGVDCAIDVELQDMPPGYSVSNGKFKGWCIQQDQPIQSGYIWPGTLYNPYGASTPPAWRNQSWNQVNHILNHKGNAGREDVQQAIWYFVGRSATTPLVLSATAEALVQDARNNGECFTPGAGQTAGVILVPEQGQQVILLELPAPGSSQTLSMAASSASSSQMTVTFEGPINRTIVIESSTDLRSWQVFKTMFNTSGSNSTALPLDKYSPGRFYRARFE